MVQPEVNHPGEHDEPPESLDHIELPMVTTMQSWFRLHRLHRDAIHFGRARRSRFDAPNSEYGVLYAAADPFGAFSETIEIQAAYNVLTESVIAGRTISRIDVSRPLRLVDITGSGLRRIGADGRLTNGSHAVAQLWARTLWAHSSTPDGIMYRARHDLSRISVALFDRAELDLQAVNLGRLSDARLADLLADILLEYRFNVIDDSQ